MRRLVLLLFVLISVLQLSSAVDPRQEKEKQLLDRVLDNYDRQIRPYGAGGGPTLVNINMYVRSMDSVDDHKMEYSCQLTFRAEWNDARLNYSQREAGEIRFLTLTDSSKIWMPDIFFANEKESHRHDLLTPNVYIRISPNGNVLYSVRLSLTLSCPMNLRKYPFDTQTCYLRLASYGYIDSHVKFIWKETDPVQMFKDPSPGRFTMEEVSTDTCDSTTTTGTYSCLRADFTFKRVYGHYQIQIYIPCSMMMLIGWLSLWLDPKSTGRLITCLVTLLVMACLISLINANMIPPTNYTKAVDVWTGVSLTFNFVTLLIYVVVNYLTRFNTQEQVSQSTPPEEQTEETTKIDLEEGNETTGNKGKTATLKRTKEMATKYWGGLSTKAQKVDVAARILYPIAFFIFNILYWACYKW